MKAPVFNPIPVSAEKLPDVAETLEQARLPFYCINCYRKAETAYVTPNLGPLCRDCMKELEVKP